MQLTLTPEMMQFKECKGKTEKEKSMLDMLSTFMPKQMTKHVTKHPWMRMKLTMSLEPGF